MLLSFIESKLVFNCFSIYVHYYFAQRMLNKLLKKLKQEMFNKGSDMMKLVRLHGNSEIQKFRKTKFVEINVALIA